MSIPSRFALSAAAVLLLAAGPDAGPVATSTSPFVGSAPGQAVPVEVIHLFDERLFECCNPVLPDPFVRETATVRIVKGERDRVLLSSTPDGTGAPIADDSVAINGRGVQGAYFIPLAVADATGDTVSISSCSVGVTIDRCAFPYPHWQAVDVSESIPNGSYEVTIDILDFGGGYGHSPLYLVIVPRPLQ